MTKTPRNHNLWLWILSAIVVLVVGAAIAVPHLLTACCASTESKATSTLRSLNTAMVTYQSTFNSGYPEGLNRLGVPSHGPPDLNNADLVDPVLAGRSEGGTNFSFTKDGYLFWFTPGPGGFGRITTYSIQADPIKRGKTGQRSFFTNETFVIRANPTAAATASDTPV